MSPTWFVFALVLTVVVVVREVSAARERRLLLRTIGILRTAITDIDRALSRTMEDVYVLRCLLAERRTLSEEDFVQGRSRWIDKPRLVEMERRQIQEVVGEAPRSTLVIDVDENKLH